MAEDASNAHFQSITEAATASWYAHRASIPNSKQSPFIHRGSTQRQTSSSTSPVPTLEEVAAQMAAVSEVSSTISTHTSSRRDSEVEAPGEANIHSDIDAWQSALQCLPSEFANAPVPLHPLARALIKQPTLRPVEWNQRRQQGGFVPRTAHDYSSLMIYISGQVNPNPCRNCLLRNGPFARCVVSPPAVLAISTLRHACANCTYQNQYKKCTNEPISEQEKARMELARSVISSKNSAPRSTIPRKPKTPSRTKHDGRKLKRRLQELQQNQLEEPRDVSMGQSPAILGVGGLGDSLTLFDEKLRYIRASSPRSRRRMAAETLQWQAAIATIEAEGPAPAPDLSIPGPIHEATLNHHLRAPLNNYTPSQLVSASPAATAAPIFAVNSPAGTRATSYSAENTYEAMDEDESEGEEEGDDYEGTPWAGPNHTDSIIKAPR
ncbi:hypothetical protein E0Z10_g21 [Xylaria hypoxylon]|uniref:Uncharacterized protein n=1 Tax=Xylaria hypoxylon TaxID=37992 RepID=A0A4Z0ZAG9_9PEZI|nr:hypothetical protein E0Z10_g21 [Xylaria hypoxylon]